MDIQKILGSQLNARFAVRRHIGLMKELDPIIVHNVWRMWRSNEV